MKFKSLVKVLLSCVLAGTLLTGCGSQDNSKVDENSQARIVKLGMIAHLNVSEKQMEEYMFKIQEKTHAKISNRVPVFFDNLSLMKMALESGNVNEISVYKCVADYLLAGNDNLEIVRDDATAKMTDAFCFAVRKEDTALKADLDKVIGEMKSDGTLDKLINEYITNANKGQVPSKVEIPVTEGAPKIKIGVTGDLPPLDFVNADNTPAGFNTAMLAEVSKRLGRNIEIVDIDSGARGAALTSDQIDVVFWAIVPIGEKIPADIDKPEGLELSTPYFEDSLVHLKFKGDK